ncbi:alpha/beta fold hydrolase [Rhizobium viscosum]|uniref:Pimeloyl-ACP methyl ester carboxylesterase n=1 Tax=Rhizobium viscosum TaxID=1673 RepID=A0ABR9INN5_RHIVS|nr:alpha/beta hydrolase [Rhizobium viscosum]MBE1504517.1 pimeloyl-ACP methyl ester carboxylesterase [Rhizobium viscosum]
MQPVSDTTSAATSSGAQQPTVVLVHGAWADGSTWSRLISLLQEKGVNVVAVQNPLTSLADDIATTQRALDNLKDPVVLVGWSYGGAVITEAGENDNVKALVYVAAFALSEGMSVNETAKDYPPPSGFSHVQADKNGFLTLTLEGVQQHLAQDIAPEQTKVIFATQHPTHAQNFDGKVSAAAWTTKPSWYVVSEQDRMIQPDLQIAMAQKISANVTTLQAGHAPHISRSSEVAKVIFEAIAHITK